MKNIDKMKQKRIIQRRKHAFYLPKKEINDTMPSSRR
jgi:hypothetical protein